MSSEREAYSIADILTGFTSAESVAEEVIDQILTEGGRQLYESYIDKKSFSFGSEAISGVLISEVRMCFVRHDEGEPLLPGHRASIQLDIPNSSVERSTSSASACLPEGEAGTEVAGAGDKSVAASSSTARARENATKSLSIEVDGDDDGGQVPVLIESVGMDAGSPSRDVSCFSWELEAEPERCRIDTWARACVPVRRTLVRPAAKAAAGEGLRKQLGAKQVGNTTKKLSLATPTAERQRSTGTPSSTSNQRGHPSSMLSTVSNTATSPNAAEGKKNPNDGMIPLVETVENDEEETALREMKERESKRKRDEDNRIQRKVTEEAEEAARLAQVKDQMKNKPYTYDSAGNIIWVTPFPAEKLPSANPVPNYVLRRDLTAEVQSGDKKTSNPAEQKKSRKEAKYGAKSFQKGKQKEMDFVDTFKKFSSQQPMMTEAMKMAPGVRLSERGITKSGEDHTGGNAHSNNPMTRRDYENLVQGGTSGYPPKDKDENKEGEGSGPPSNTQSTQQLGAPGAAPAEGEATGPATLGANPGHRDGSPSRANRAGVKAVAPTTAAAAAAGGMVPHAPSTPRPVQPAPPPSARRVQLKRDAVGFSLSSRERVPTGTGSRFPGCAGPPPLGATMGHGLVPLASKQQEYYFPQSNNALGLRIVDEDDASMGGSAQGASAVAPAPVSPHGQIVSKNPELVRRLLNR